jgi:histidyl-tRNA synthetase
MQVLEYLDDLNIKYNLNTRLVESREYFNRTIFEFYLDYEQVKTDEGKKKNAGLPLAVGARYDGLTEALGGKVSPAAGMSIYLERTISKIRELKIEAPDLNEIDVFIAQIGADAKKEAFKLHEKLMRAGIKVKADFPQDGLKAQLEKAAQYKAKISLILGQKELLDQTIIIRDMQSGIQEIANYERVIQEVKKRIDPELTSVKQYKIKKTGKNKADDKQQKKIFDSRTGQKYNSSLEDGSEILNENIVAYDYTEQKEDKGFDSQVLF